MPDLPEVEEHRLSALVHRERHELEESVLNVIGHALNIHPLRDLKDHVETPVV